MKHITNKMIDRLKLGKLPCNKCMSIRDKKEICHMWATIAVIILWCLIVWALSGCTLRMVASPTTDIELYSKGCTQSYKDGLTDMYQVNEEEKTPTEQWFEDNHINIPKEAITAYENPTKSKEIG